MPAGRDGAPLVTTEKAGSGGGPAGVYANPVCACQKWAVWEATATGSVVCVRQTFWDAPWWAFPLCWLSPSVRCGDDCYVGCPLGIPCAGAMNFDVRDGGIRPHGSGPVWQKQPAA